jgi:hypothetical protein
MADIPNQSKTAGSVHHTPGAHIDLAKQCMMMMAGNSLDDASFRLDRIIGPILDIVNAFVVIKLVIAVTSLLIIGIRLVGHGPIVVVIVFGLRGYSKDGGGRQGE